VMLFFLTVLSYENLLFTGDISPQNKFFTKLFDVRFCVPECPVLMLRIRQPDNRCNWDEIMLLLKLESIREPKSNVY